MRQVTGWDYALIRTVFDLLFLRIRARISIDPGESQPKRLFSPFFLWVSYEVRQNLC